MSNIFVQMGVFYSSKDQPTVVMFKVDEPFSQDKIASTFTMYGNLLIAQHQIRQAESRCVEGDMLNDERAANAILDLYHKVSNQPVLLEHVIASASDTHNTITIKVRKEV